MNAYVALIVKDMKVFFFLSLYKKTDKILTDEQ